MGKGKGKGKKKADSKSGASADADALESKEKADEERKVAEVAEEMVADGVHPLGGFSDALRVEKGFVLADVDTSSTPAFAGDKIDGKAALESSQEELADLLERLWAESTAGSRRSLLLVVQGFTTREIADKLGLSLKTAETHRIMMMKRLGIHDVAGLVRYAVKVRLIGSDG